MGLGSTLAGRGRWVGAGRSPSPSPGHRDTVGHPDRRRPRRWRNLRATGSASARRTVGGIVVAIEHLQPTRLGFFVVCMPSCTLRGMVLILASVVLCL